MTTDAASPAYDFEVIGGRSARPYGLLLHPLTAMAREWIAAWMPSAPRVGYSAGIASSQMDALVSAIRNDGLTVDGESIRKWR